MTPDNEKARRLEPAGHEGTRDMRGFPGQPDGNVTRAETLSSATDSGSDNVHCVNSGTTPGPFQSINPERLWQQIRSDRIKRAADAQQAALFGPRQLNLEGEWEPWEPRPPPELPENTPDGAPLPAAVPLGPLDCTPTLWDRQEQLALALEGRGLQKRADRHRLCNRTWNTWQCSACEGETTAAIATCDLRVCVSCQRRQSKELAAKTRRKLDAIGQRKGWRLRLITLTVRTDGLEDMRRAVKLLGRALPKLWRKVLKAEGAGAMFALEAGEARGNIHCHGLYYGPWVDQKELSAEWSKLTGGSFVVHVTEAKGAGAVAEVCKYVCHPALKVELQAALEDALQGTRRVRTYGTLYGCEPEPEETPGRTCPCCGTVGDMQLLRTVFLAPSGSRATGPPH